MTGGGEDSTKEFTFTVTLSDKTISGTIRGGSTASVVFDDYKSGGGSGNSKDNGGSGKSTGDVVSVNTYEENEEVEDDSDSLTDISPETGDTSNMAFWCVLACLSLSGMAIALFEKKRN